MSTFYKIQIPFHWYENDYNQNLTLVRVTLKEAREVRTDFEKAQNSADYAVRILIQYDYYGDGCLCAGKIRIIKATETEID